MIGHVLTFSGERGRPSTRNEFPGQISGWSVHSGRSLTNGFLIERDETDAAGNGEEVRCRLPSGRGEIGAKSRRPTAPHFTSRRTNGALLSVGSGQTPIWGL